MNKKIFNNFDKEKNYNLILKKINHKNTYFKYALLPICLLLISILIINDRNASLKNINHDDEKIKINKISDVSHEDLNIKTVDMSYYYIPYFDFIGNLEIPNDLTKISMRKIFTENNGEEVLNNYEFTYSNDNRVVKISFSSDHQPLRDYYFDNSGSKKSIISNHEVTIYQNTNINCENYIAIFENNDYKFDIETKNITQDELITLITSTFASNK